MRVVEKREVVARVGGVLAGVGVLAAVAVVLGRRARRRREDAARRARYRDRLPSGEELEELELAAATAVAVALAQSARRVHPTHSWHAASPGQDPSPWQAHARDQQLGQRKVLRP